MAMVPLFRDAVLGELSALAAAIFGGALLISPADNVVLASGDVTLDGALVARTNAPRVTTTLDDRVVVLHCDDGSRVHLLPVSEGWVLAVQRRVELSMGDTVSVRRARDKLSALLAHTPVRASGGRDPGRGGAPVELFVGLPSKRTNGFADLGRERRGRPTTTARKARRPSSRG